MTPFFTQDNIDRLEEFAIAWTGTPFAPGGAVCGPRGGASCVRLVAAGIISCGFPLDQDEIPDAPLNRASHHVGSMMEDWLRVNPERFEEVPASEICPGDLLLIKLGIGVHHIGLALAGDRMMHTWQHMGAHVIHHTDPQMKKRIHSVFRPLKPTL